MQTLDMTRTRYLISDLRREEVASGPGTVGSCEGEMKTLTENQVAAGLLNDFIDVEHLEYFHLKPLYEVKI